MQETLANLRLNLSSGKQDLERLNIRKPSTTPQTP